MNIQTNKNFTEINNIFPKRTYSYFSLETKTLTTNIEKRNSRKRLNQVDTI